MSRRLPFVITVDDAGLTMPQEVEERSIRFFQDQDVPASFFVVPETSDGKGLADDRAWLARARVYIGQGFDYQLHSYRHEGFEFGPPEPWMIRICGDDAIASEACGFSDMRHLWTDDALRERFRKAIGAFERAFERPPEVFRAGCLAAAEDAFRVMGELGLRYDSDKIVNPKAWDYIAQQFDSPRPWEARVPPYPYRLNDTVVELPCIGEYAWTLSPGTLHHFTDLAAGDMERVHAQGGVFILMCHQQRVGDLADDLPRLALETIFRTARERYDAEFLTLRDLVGRVETGSEPVRESVSPASA